MILSDTTLKIIGSVIAGILSLLLAYITSIMSYKWRRRHGNINEVQTSITKFFNLFILCCTVILSYWLANKFLQDSTALVALLAISIIALIAFFLFMSSRFGKRDMITTSILLLMFIPWLCIGITATITWLIPDITIVYKDSGKHFISRTAYEWHPDAGMNLTGSYIENLTDDTLYRVVVSYAIPGEDLYNVYSVSGIFPPKTFDRMKSKADYYMHPLPPFMRWSTGRMGRYRTQRIFVVDKKMLLKFIHNYDMSLFGLQPHRRVDSLKENNNRVIHEDPARLTEYKGIINIINSQKNH